ncbi:diguanylate cyclase [Nitriliruptoraceae bacterium ZYF776]|nr:diguanylate cyclase [Profundirhabdus halotolerans]
MLWLHPKPWANTRGRPSSGPSSRTAWRRRTSILTSPTPRSSASRRARRAAHKRSCAVARLSRPDGRRRGRERPTPRGTVTATAPSSLAPAPSTETCAAPSRAAQLLQATPDPIWFTDATTGRVFDANPAAAALFGWDLTQRLPVGDEVLTRASRAMLGVEAAALSDGVTWTGELTLCAADGVRVPASVAVTSGEDADGRRWFGVIARDVRRAQEIERQLRHRARHDALTGLENREGLLETLEVLVADRGGAVLHLDLDRFKAVNDALGRRVGDALLVAVARRLTTTVDDGASFARLGADAFVVVLPAAGEDEAEVVAGRLRDAIELPFVLGEHDLQINVSVGVAAAAPGELPAERLLQHADTAMFLAKDAGGGVELYDEHAHRRVVEGIARRHELRGALDRGEFRLVYQPLVALPGERMTGVEALLRWVHPSFGPVGPDTFIPMLEEDGGIVEVGRWVLREALRQLASWDVASDGASHLGVNVNVSVHQLGPELVADVIDALADTGGPGRAVDRRGDRERPGAGPRRGGFAPATVARARRARRPRRLRDGLLVARHLARPADRPPQDRPQLRPGDGGDRRSGAGRRHRADGAGARHADGRGGRRGAGARRGARRPRCRRRAGLPLGGPAAGRRGAAVRRRYGSPLTYGSRRRQRTPPSVMRL